MLILKTEPVGSSILPLATKLRLGGAKRNRLIVRHECQ